MALIKCTECGHEVSDKASACPKCGNYILQDNEINEVETLSNSPIVKGRMKIWVISVAIGLLLIGGIGTYALSSRGNSPATAPNAPILSVANNSDSVGEIDTIVRITPAFTKAISQYDRLGIFNDGFAAVCKNEKWGYINVRGEEVIPTQIDAYCAGRFSEGLAFVIESWDKFIVIDTQGRTVFSNEMSLGFDAMQYESSDMPYYIGGKLYVPFFDESSASIRFAIFDKKGKRLADVKGEEGFDYYKRNGQGDYVTFFEEVVRQDDWLDSQSGIKDANGNVIITAKYDKVITRIPFDYNWAEGDYRHQIHNGVVLVALLEQNEDSELSYEGVVTHYAYADLKGNDTFTDNVRLLCKNSMNKSTGNVDSQEQHYAQAATNNVVFNSWGDFCDYFRTTKKYQGRSAYFNGIIEIKTNDSEISVYVGGKYLSSLGLVSQNQKFLFGDYARMAVYVEGRTYPVVIHLPDSQHPYGYFYFEPIATSTNRNLASALNLPIEDGWMWVEPQIENGKGTLVWHTDSKTKPTPIIYKLIE
jgi:hypothetical protein